LSHEANGKKHATYYQNFQTIVALIIFLSLHHMIIALPSRPHPTYATQRQRSAGVPVFLLRLSYPKNVATSYRGALELEGAAANNVYEKRRCGVGRYACVVTMCVLRF